VNFQFGTKNYQSGCPYENQTGNGTFLRWQYAQPIRSDKIHKRGKKRMGCAIFIPLLLLLCVRDTNRSRVLVLPSTATLIAVPYILTKYNWKFGSKFFLFIFIYYCIGSSKLFTNLILDMNDEVGSRIAHNDKPTFAQASFYYIPRAVSYTLVSLFTLF
jgi:hypothetical protein